MILIRFAFCAMPMRVAHAKFFPLGFPQFMFLEIIQRVAKSRHRWPDGLGSPVVSCSILEFQVSRPRQSLDR